MLDWLPGVVRAGNKSLYRSIYGLSRRSKKRQLKKACEFAPGAKML